LLIITASLSLDSSGLYIHLQLNVLRGSLIFLQQRLLESLVQIQVPNPNSGKLALYDPQQIAQEPKFKIAQEPQFNFDITPVVPILCSKCKSTALLYKLMCAKCGSDYRVEMHHVRATKNLNRKISEVDRLMVRANRKQVPLCRECHMKYHHNQIWIEWRAV